MIGTNELLAAAGLGGGTYQPPKSGLQESSKIQQESNLQNILAGYNVEERQAISALSDAIRSYGVQNQQNIAGIEQQTEASMQAAKAQNYQLLQEVRSNVASYASSGALPPNDLKQQYEKLSGESYDELLKRKEKS